MKTILITGSTDGIGKLTALKLAKDGHKIIVHGRNSEKLHNTVSEIKKVSNNQNVIGLVSDFSDFDSIKKMVAEISNEVSSLDVLINNAGVFNSPVEKNKDGLDIRFVVNYFAPFLLTNGLLSLFKTSKLPRIINLSSAAQSSISFNALEGLEIIGTQDAYAQSKLALTIWSFYLSRKFESLNVIAVNPGSLLNTKMVQEAYGNFWSSADKGANILYDLAISEQYTNSTGKYLDNDKGVFSNAHSDTYNSEITNQLISKTNSILGL